MDDSSAFSYVAIEQLEKPPYQARVDFYMFYYSPADHSELKRILYTANFVFYFRTHVPNDLIRSTRSA